MLPVLSSDEWGMVTYIIRRLYLAPLLVLGVTALIYAAVSDISGALGALLARFPRELRGVGQRDKAVWAGSARVRPVLEVDGQYA